METSSFSHPSIGGTLGSHNHNPSFPFHYRGPTTLELCSHPLSLPQQSLCSFLSVYQYALESPIFKQEQNKRASFESITISSYHLVTQHHSKTSQENCLCLFLHFLACHSLLNHLGRATPHIISPSLLLSRV